MTYYGLYEEANRLFDKGKINYGEYEKMIEPLNDEVRKVGKWIRTEEGELICSKCEYPAEFNPLSSDFIETNYCPNCGAKMERSE